MDTHVLCFSWMLSRCAHAVHFWGKDAGSTISIPKQDHSQPGGSGDGTHPQDSLTGSGSRRLWNEALPGTEDPLGPQVTSVALGSQYAQLMGVSVALAG